MAKGGKREGAGRKPGVKSQKTVQREALAASALAQGITPLEVMLEAMREAHQAGQKREAASIAKDAAPYVHPRLSNVDMNAKVEGGIKVSLVNEFE